MFYTDKEKLRVVDMMDTKVNNLQISELYYYPHVDPCGLYTSYRNKKRISAESIAYAVERVTRQSKYIEELEQRLYLLEKYLNVEYVRANSQPKKAHYKKCE